MPQIQMLPESPSFGGQIGKALGTGLGQGVSAGLQAQLKQFQEDKKKREKNLEKIRPVYKFYKDEFGFKDIPENESEELYKKARGLIEKGFTPDEAVEQVFNEYRTRGEEAAPGEKEGGSAALKGIKELTRAPAKILMGASSLLPQAYEGAKKLFAPPEERAPAVPRENIQERLKEAEEAGPAIYNKFLSTLSNEEMKQLPFQQRAAISKQVGEIAQAESERSLARGIFGKEGVDKIAKAGGLPDIEFGTPGGQKVGEITGQILRDLALFQTAGQLPLGMGTPNLPQQALSAATLFGGAKAGEKLLAGETPTMGEVGGAAVFGAAAQVGPELLGRLFNFLKAKIPVRGKGSPPPPPPSGPGAAPAMKELEYRPRGDFKSGEVPPSPPPGPQSGPEAQELYNKIINDSVKNLEGRGITLEMINSGDPAAIKALQEEANKIANLYKQAEKVNEKAFHKQRNEILQKIPESPLEKYYEPKKEVVSRPETIAKNQERIKPLELLIKQNERRVQDLQYQILSSDEAIRSGKYSPAEIERIKATRDANALAHTQAMDAIRNAKFEIKYGRPPATLEDISKQIETTFNELREGIKNPDAKKVETFRKGFERDKHMIDEALKLAERGELPGPEVFDEYIKIHKEYSKAYDSLIEELKAFIEEAKGKPRMKAKTENAQKLLDLIKNQKKLTDAKIKLQEDKRKAMAILEKPSGAFIKNSLRETKKDIAAFQKDFFTWNKIATGTEAKTAQVAKERIKPPPKVEEKVFQRKTQEPKEPPKVQKKHAKGKAGQAKETIENAEKGAKNPSSPEGEATSETAGMSKEEYQDYLNQIRKKAAKGKESVKNGTAGPETELSLAKQILSVYKKLPKLAKGAINGVIIGTIQGLSEEYFGFKPNQALISSGVAAATKGNIGVKTGAGGVAAYVTKYIRDSFNSASARRLKELRSKPTEYNAYLKKLKEKYGDSRAAKIRKEALTS